MSEARPERRKLGRYELVSRIATGGMAEVWLARATGVEGFEKTVVIKTILPHLADDPDFVKMFINEALLAAALDHPNVVQIFDLGSIEDAYFIAMEFISGRTLRQIHRTETKRKGLIPVWLALKIGISVCDALEHAHFKTDEEGKPLGIVHRDITPENVMVSFSGVTKVLDFGIAKASSVAVVTVGGRLKGKYAYLSPEQIASAAKGGATPVDGRADLYALGVVLYEILTGRRPFEGASELALLRAILRDRPTPPCEANGALPAALGDVVLKALARIPRERYEDAGALRADLEAVLMTLGPPRSARHVANYVRGLFGVEGPITTGPRPVREASSRVRTARKQSQPAPAPAPSAEAATESSATSDVTIELSNIIETSGGSADAVAEDSRPSASWRESFPDDEPAAASEPGDDEVELPDLIGSAPAAIAVMPTGAEAVETRADQEVPAERTATADEGSIDGDDEVPDLRSGAEEDERWPEPDDDPSATSDGADVGDDVEIAIDARGAEEESDGGGPGSSWDLVVSRSRTPKPPPPAMVWQSGASSPPAPAPEARGDEPPTPKTEPEAEDGAGRRGRERDITSDWDAALQRAKEKTSTGRRAFEVPAQAAPARAAAFDKSARPSPEARAAAAFETKGRRASGPEAGTTGSRGKKDGATRRAGGAFESSSAAPARAADPFEKRAGLSLSAEVRAVASFDRGLVLVKEGRLTEALAVWEEAHALDPANRKYASNLRRLRAKLEGGGR